MTRRRGVKLGLRRGGERTRDNVAVDRVDELGGEGAVGVEVELECVRGGDGADAEEGEGGTEGHGSERTGARQG